MLGREGGEIGHGVHEAAAPVLRLGVCHKVALDVLDRAEDRFQHSVRVVLGVRGGRGQKALYFRVCSLLFEKIVAGALFWSEIN